MSKLSTDFSVIHTLIVDAKHKASYQVNKILIELYWRIGQYVSEKITQEGWGKSVVDELSKFLLSKDSGLRGFSARNLWRMKQFYESYNGNEKLSALLTEITWTNHLQILSKSNSLEEREFYLELAASGNYSSRLLGKLIDRSTFERTQLANKKLPAVMTEFPADTTNVFKDIYLFEFTDISDAHKEKDLNQALVRHLKNFLLEMGPDFSLIGQEYAIQVGNKDFYIDLLMHHRGLNCLVAIELKTTDFKPAHLGQLQFYLEALDRNIKKSHENPSIGMLICKTKDEEVVEYALSRNVSPTMIAEYKMQLVDKEILRQKLHELSEMMALEAELI